MSHLEKNVDNWERVASVIAGGALVALALRRQKWSQAVAGAALIGRGASGYCPANAAMGRGRLRDDPRRALSGPRGVRLDDRVTIRRPIDEVYEFWRDLSNLPRAMGHIERIDVLDSKRSHWVMRGPAGTRVEWDAAIINEERPKLLAWESMPGADVASAGSVRLKETAAGTEVAVSMQYNPPAGKVGAALAWLSGHSPAASLHEELLQVKRLLETGRAVSAVRLNLMMPDAEILSRRANWREARYRVGSRCP